MNQKKTQDGRFIVLLSDRQTPKICNIQDTLKCLLTPKSKIETPTNYARETEKSFYTKKIEINRKNSLLKKQDNHTVPSQKGSHRRPTTSIKNKDAFISSTTVYTHFDSENIGKYFLTTSDLEFPQPENKKTFVKFKNFYRVVKTPSGISPTKPTQVDNLQRMVCTQMKQIVDVKSKEYTLTRPESHQVRSRQFSLDVKQRKLQRISLNVPKYSKTFYGLNEHWPGNTADWVDFMFESVMNNNIQNSHQ